MFNNRIGSDTQLRADDSDPDAFIHCHKIILCQRSEVLKNMLVNQTETKDILIKDISHKALYKLVEFIYTDMCEITPDIVLELFKVADKYQLPRLKYLSEQYIQENINLDNVCTILETADMLHANSLRAECMRWILTHFGDILKSENYLDLRKDLKREINVAASHEYFDNNLQPNKRRKLNDDSRFPCWG